MVARESVVLAGLSWMATVLTGLFALAMWGWADDMTSKQWRYLFSFPGQHYTWMTIFAMAAILIGVGLLRTWYRFIAVGYGLIGAAALLIATLYVVAPTFGGVKTFGWYPWPLVTAVTLVFSAVYWRPRPWF